jgi:arylsulfatase A-like enzyme
MEAIRGISVYGFYESGSSEPAMLRFKQILLRLMIAVVLFVCMSIQITHAKSVVLILTDDMIWQMFDDRQALPTFNSVIKDQGVTFTHAYYYDALCCPSRASMLSGKYGHNHGVTANGWHKFREELDDNISTWIKAEDVSTLMVGKFLNGWPGAVPPGWDYFASTLESKSHYFGPQVSLMGKIIQYQPEVYSTILYTDLAISAVRKAVGDGKDFFLWLSFHAPHLPSTPEAKFANAFPDAKVPRVSPNQRILASWDTSWRKQLQTLASVDEQIKRFIDVLKELGKFEDTYFIVLPDNGWMPGGLNGLGKMKAVPFDAATKAGLFVSGPGIKRAEIDALVNNADIAPTIAELLGATVPNDLDGRSFASLLIGPGTHTRQVMPLFHKDGVENRYPGYKGLRTKEILYVERTDGKKLLFNSRTDPWQENDIFAAAPASLKRQLAERTAALAECKGAQCRELEDTPLPVFLPPPDQAQGGFSLPTLNDLENEIHWVWLYVREQLLPHR